MAKKIYSIFMMIIMAMLFPGFLRVELLSKISLLVEFSFTLLLVMIAFEQIKVSNLIVKILVIFGIVYEFYYNIIYISFEMYSMIGLMMFLPLYIILIKFSFKQNNRNISF